MSLGATYKKVFYSRETKRLLLLFATQPSYLATTGMKTPQPIPGATTSSTTLFTMSSYMILHFVEGFVLCLRSVTRSNKFKFVGEVKSSIAKFGLKGMKRLWMWNV
ncbi:hypothetical protein Mp_6g20260 [Marchantia polymorpha subsp. ruderalis]|uniref:Uncharacterized protein n=2 Tax=Marchantia polymorpha TaxID=3197 RepID=A0AAF6BU41_MARPO|nr:hypothetical protein MARPO_0045s0038 [Marchantia polymorpha]BBN15525.1 hypothetical protein Mp_6g20260 [Marchantia polymorpha subsp. ruderalis]|eukprot:PTQ39364.1 hypothetical protein MARPO_0045s0038 [Marchantia polymorpha]